MERNYKYKAFISYSHRDWKWAKWLHRGLESYRTPEYLVGSETSAGRIPARLTPVFRDRDELPSASNLSEHIKEALRDSENLILICSRDAARSRWVNQEVETFKRLGRSDRIFSLIVDGDPVAEGTDEDCFPPALRSRYDASGDDRPGTVEPIAADSRKQRDGRSLARLKIIAGLLGVGLDDLRQRELQRRHRRLAVVTVTSLAALAVTMILAINAYLARNDANQRREQAEDLLSFMVVDLRERLTPIGRLDLLEEIGERAMAYFATVDVADLTNEELLRQAQVMTQLGEIRMDQRQYDDALTSFIQAYDRSAELYRSDPADGDHLFARGQAEFWVGYVNWRRGDVDSARDWWTRYLVSSQELTDLDQNRDDWAIEVAYGYHNLAVLAWESDDLEAADEGFNRELDTLVELQARDTSRDLKRDIADVVSWLGAVSLGRGQLSDALEYYERSAADLRSLSLEEPNDAERQYDWAASALWIVEVSSITGDIDRADELIDQAISVFDDLVARDDANKEWLRSSLLARISKGNLLAARGVWDFAREYATTTTALLKELIAEEASDLAAREQLVDAYGLLAWIDHASGNFAAALDFSQEALSNMQVVQQAGRLNDDRLGKLASIYVVRGQLQAASEQPEEAQESWQHAARLLRDRASTARSPQLLDPWVRVLMRLGRDEEARVTFDELNARSYRPLRPWPELPD